MGNTVVGLFEHFEDAQAALKDLIDGGFAREEISLIANDVTASQAPGGQTVKGVEANPTGDAGSMAGFGVMMGGIAGMLIGLAALAVPGIGLVLAAGPVAAALTGAGIGAVAGGLLGALVDSGVPETDANVYAEGVRRGGALITVYTTGGGFDDRAAEIMNRHDPVNIEQKMNEWFSDGRVDLPGGQRPADGMILDGTPYEAEGAQQPRRARVYESKDR